MTQLERNNIVHWYRIDKDQNEVASEADLRAARSAEWTDDQVAAEFNHLDVNGDSELTFDEFSHVRTEDKVNFLTWFRSLANRDGDSYYMESWEHTYDDSGLVVFSDADSDGDYKLTEYEACPHFHHEYPSVC